MPSTIDTESQRERTRRGQLCFTKSTSKKKYKNKGDGERNREVPGYGDTSATYWNLYLSEAEINDKNLVNALVGDTESMGLVNTIFSTIVAAFIIEMYKTLDPATSFKSSNIAIRMNTVMFLSLFCSMMSVIASALIRQWCREYLKAAYPRIPPHKRGRVRTYLFQGLGQSQIRRLMYGIHGLLHISVFLFFWAVGEFLYNFSEPVGNVARYCLFTSLVVYMAFSICPLILISSPYHTALTPLLRVGFALALLIFSTLRRFIPGFRKPSFPYLRYFKGIRFNKAHFLMDEANSRAGQVDHYAMQWLFTENNFSDNTMDAFLEALPGYIHSHLTDKQRLADQLTSGYVIERIEAHFLTCATSYWLSEDACIARVSACVNSLQLIFKTNSRRLPGAGEEGLQTTCIQGLINNLNNLCDDQNIDRRVALRASCVRSLAFQDLLTHLPPPDADMTPTQAFPVHLVPWYSSFCVREEENRGNIPQAPPSMEYPNSPLGEESETMWKTLLHDGPLVNLTRLAEAVLSHDHIHPHGLSLCWKTLESLLKEFGIARMKVSDSALKRFNEVHDKAQQLVQVEHRGFRVIPLLEILDTVARGRRLSMVFLNHPKYYGKADAVFGKKQLRDSNLMGAFASCLPAYVANIPQEERRAFMEGMVCDDDLWTSLQVNLWNAVRLDSPIPDKLRIFEACCAVFDVMFVTLEDSDKVDWRAPDFGSLSQHYELFVSNCLQGTFIRSATTFRHTLLGLRFCKALLTQFRKELDQEGAVILRSQWDIASLARVFQILGVGDEEDMVYWRSYNDGGHTGPEFMTKFPQMLDTAIRDGPLLNFCKLGHLAVTAVPFAGLGPERADVDMVQALQKNILEDENLPLNRASADAWEKFRQLRLEVCDVITRCNDEEKDMLGQLLENINDAHDLCPPSQRLHPGQLEQSAHASSQNDESGPNLHHLPSSSFVIHNRITGRVMNQSDVLPYPFSRVHPRSAFREPSRGYTMPTYLHSGRDGSGLTANATARPPT